MHAFFLFLLLVISPISGFCAKFVCVTVSSNDIHCIEETLSSLFRQEFTDWRLIYIDNASKNGAKERALNCIDQYRMSNKCDVITNIQPKKYLENLVYASSLCIPEEIIVLIDDDEHFSSVHELSRLDKIYNGFIWMTFNGIDSYSKDTMEKKAFRNVPAIQGSPKTFYAGLFQKIKQQDLSYRTDVFFPEGAEHAFGYPLLEMCSPGHFAHHDSLLVQKNPSRYQSSKAAQFQKMIAQLPKYAPIKSVRELFNGKPGIHDTAK